MAESFTEVSDESWFSRIGNSFKALLVGGVLFLVSFPVLFWNEGRAVLTAKSLNEGEKSVVSVSSESLDSTNNDKLVHTSGIAETTETLTDEIFSVAENALRLARNAEMYQWKEKVHTKKKKKLGGGTRTEKTYDYEKTWSSKVIDSERFKRTNGHENPTSMPIQSGSQQAQHVTLGAFTMPKDLVARISNSEPIAASEEMIPEEYKETVKVAGNDLYMGADAGQPQIGDIRISFTKTPASEVTVVAQQSGDTFRPYQTHAGRQLSMLEVGNHSSEVMFQHARDANNTMTWILRAVGAAMMFGGLVMLMSPLAVLGDVIPFIGSIIAGGSWLVAGVITLICGSTTIAIAWLFYRPLIAVPLLALAIGGTVYLFMNRKTASPGETMTMDDVLAG